MKLVITDEIKKIFFNAGWLFLEKVFRLILTIYVAAMVARYLGPERFGIYNYVFSFVIIFFPLLNIAANNIVVKELVRKTKSIEFILGSSLLLKFSGSIVAIVSINLISYFKNIDNFELRIMILLMSFDLVIKSFEVIDSLFQSKVESKYIVISKSVSFLVASVLRLSFIIFHMSLFYFVLCFIIESALFVLGFIYFYKLKHSGSIFKFKVNLPLMKNIFLESLPLIFTGIAISIFMNVDIIMLKEFTSDYMVGVYSVAVKMSSLWHFIPMAITTSIFPSIIKLKDSDNRAYWIRIKRLFTLMTYLALIISIIITIFSGPVIKLLFSEMYIDSIPVLKIHIWSSIFIFWGVTQQAWDVAEKMLKVMLIRTVFAAILNVVLNYIFIPKWGVIGAAWATLISQASVIFMNIIHRKTRQILLVELTSPYCK